MERSLSDSVSVSVSESKKVAEKSSEWPNARTFVEAWKRHMKFRRDQPEQVVAQTLIGRNGTVDWNHLVEVHPSYCAYHQRHGWQFCSLTLLEWIDMGMPAPPPEAVQNGKESFMERLKREDPDYA